MSEDAPLLTASSRRRGGAALAAVVLALAGGLAFAVANRSEPSLVASVNEAINNGKLKERLLYWADHFEADWADDLAPAAGPANNAMTQLNSGLHGKVGSIEKWLLIVIVVLGAVCLLCCVCCIIHVGTCGIL